MKRLLGAALIFVVAAYGTAQADEQEAKAVVDKAIKAMGGEEKLAKVKAYTAKGKGTIVLEGNALAFTYEATAKGVDHYRSAYQGKAGDNEFSGATVIDGDKGWRRFDDKTQKLEGDDLANEKQNAYLDIAPVLLLPLKGKGFKLDLVGDEKVDGKAVTTVRVTGPDSKVFTLSFDKETDLPVTLNARVIDWNGQAFTQDTSFTDYKDFDGVKVSTRSKTKKDGERYVDVEVEEFKAVDEVEPDTFAEPK